MKIQNFLVLLDYSEKTIKNITTTIKTTIAKRHVFCVSLSFSISLCIFEFINIIIQIIIIFLCYFIIVLCITRFYNSYSTHKMT